MPHRIEFTKTAIQAIPAAPKGTRTTIYDSKTPKLALRVTDTGARTFYLVKRAPTGMVWVNLGSFPDVTVEQARKAADKALGQFAAGTDPAQAKRTERAKMTLGEAFELYMQRHIVARNKKTGADLRQMFERCLGSLPDVPKKKNAPRERSKHPAGVDWSRRKVNAIIRDDVAGLHVDIGKTSPIVANRVVELLSAIYNKMRDFGIAVENPASTIEAFTEPERKRFLQRGELPRFFAALAEDNSDDFRDYVLLSVLTGGRQDNVLGMMKENIDEDRCVWSIAAKDAKGGEAIDVALVPEAMAILDARRKRAEAAKDNSPFVFPANSASGHMTAPKKRWRALLDRIELTELVARIKAAGGTFEWKNDGTESLQRAVIRARALATKMKIDRTGARLPTLRMHDLRRSLGSWQAILGASLTTIGKSLGHRSASATAVYARLDLDPVRASVGAATSAMLIAGGVKQSATVAAARRPRKTR